MERIRIKLNARPEYIEKTIDLIELARIPVKTVLLLRSELALFQGSNNRSAEYIDKITLGTHVSVEVMEDFLAKTIGNKEKVPGLFLHFNNSFEDTAKEMKYFGSLLLSSQSHNSLKEYLRNPEDENSKDEFLLSLKETIKSSEENLTKERDILNKYLQRVIAEVL
jgi:hypothetical protein